VFAVSPLEVAFAVLYVLGIISALYVFVVDARRVRSAILLLCALSLPVLGSVIAIALAAARLRGRCAELRSDEGGS
jgi:hypothetical protein